MRSMYEVMERVRERDETRAWLGYVGLGILKLSHEDQSEIAHRIVKLANERSLVLPGALLDLDGAVEQQGEVGIDNLPEVLQGLLEDRREERRQWVFLLHDLCEELLHEDFFGTEGQSDPRGDHRD